LLYHDIPRNDKQIAVTEAAAQAALEARVAYPQASLVDLYDQVDDAGQYTPGTSSAGYGG